MGLPALVLLPSASHAQQPAAAWSDQFGGVPFTNDSATAVAAHGNDFYLAGKSEATGYVRGAYLRKYDAAGLVIWTKHFESGDECRDVAADGTGVALLGLFQQQQGAWRGIGVRKLDLGGNEIWFHAVEPSLWDYPVKVAVLDGATYIVGTTSESLFGANNPGGRNCLVLAKIDAAGAVVWQRQHVLQDYYIAQQIDLRGADLVVGGMVDVDAGDELSTFLRSFDPVTGDIRPWEFRDPLFTLADLAVGDGAIHIVGRVTDPVSYEDQETLKTISLAGSVQSTASWGWAPWDSTMRVGADASGVYVTGRFSSTQTDGVLRKLTASGVLVWSQAYGGVGYDRGVVVALGTAGVLVFGETQLELPGQTTSGGQDATAVLFDRDGAQLWARQFGFQASTLGSAVIRGSADRATAIASDGSVYVAGSSTGVLPGQVTSGNTDAFVRKYASNGTVLWTRQFGSLRADAALGLAVDASGVYVAGKVADALPGQQFQGQAGDFSSQPADSQTDGFVRKYDHDGTEVWTRQFGSTTEDVVSCIAVDATGIFLCGWTRGSIGGQPYTGPGTQAFLQRCDLDGNLVWTRQFGPASITQIRAMCLAPGAIYVGGGTTGALDGAVQVGQVGEQDSFLCKFDRDGGVVWTRQFGALYADECLGVAADATSVYVCGRVSGSLPDQTRSGIGGMDAYLRSYDHAGAENWTRQFGTGTIARANAVAVHAGKVYVGGDCQRPLFGQQWFGNFDAFLVQYDAAGVFAWAYQFGSGSVDGVQGVSAIGGQIQLVGHVTGPLGGPVVEGTPTDAYVLVLGGSVDAVAPDADAGADLSIHAGNQVTLDGLASSDDTSATNALDYEWTLVSRPAGSVATLVGEATAAPTLFTDLPGEYVLQLIVVDEAGNRSEPDTLSVASTNQAPTADAGADLTGLVGQAMVFDGASSADPDHDALTWSWTLVSAPVGSNATLAGATTASPTLTPDVPGSYVLELVVNDGFVGSEVDTVTVVAITAAEFAHARLHAACVILGSLPASGFDAPGHQKSMCNQIAKICRFVQNGQVEQARFHLDEMLTRVDGWTLRAALDPKGLGQPHAADFVVGQADQTAVYAELAAARTALAQ